MGLIPVQGYATYKIVKKANHPTQRIPVGMAKRLWDAMLLQKEMDLAVNHAMWAAKRVAYWVETRRRHTRGLQDALDVVANDALLHARLKKFAVEDELLGVASHAVRKLVAARQKELALEIQVY